MNLFCNPVVSKKQVSEYLPAAVKGRFSFFDFFGD
jgi:hypothetical protein